MHKFEMHIHSANCSACANCTPQQIIDAAEKSGYSGLVITNHFYHGNTAVDRNLPWEEFIEEYAKDYRELKKLGKKKGITVFFGIEEGFAPGREMLIYGLEPETFSEHPEFIMMSAKEKSDFVHQNGGICVCAHPFRSRDYIPEPHKAPNPNLFDGIEGFNLCNSCEENEKAMIFAKNNKKFVISGSDCHLAEHFGNAGIAFNKPVKRYSDFIKRIKKGDFTLITPYNFEIM